jgi:hypothetical protein
VAAGEVDELRAVRGLADDLVARALQQGRQALPEQDVVVGEDHPGHGSAAFLRFAWARGGIAPAGDPC